MYSCREGEERDGGTLRRRNGRTDGRTDAAIPGDSLQGVLENEGGEEEEEEEEDGEGVVVGDGREGGGRVEVDA